MSTFQLDTARSIAEQWPLLSDINLIAMIANALNVSFDQAQSIWAKIRL